MNLLLHNKTANTKGVLTFFLKLATIWLSWKLIFYITGEEKTPIDERLFPALSAQWEHLNNATRWLVLQGSECLLNIIGYSTANDGYILRVIGERGIGLGNYCLGFQLMYYFSMLVLISELNSRKKIIAILTGIPIVIILNIFRIALLCVIVISYTAMLPVIHDYIFNAIVLGVLFAYYLFLINRAKA